MSNPVKTDTQIRALKPDIKQYSRTVQSPKLTKGTLLILVNPGGKKSFKTRYRYDDKQKGFSIGTYPNTSLLNAVEKHNEAMAVLDQGIDPKVHFEHKLADLKSKINMHQLFEKWHAIKKSDTALTQSTIDNHRWRWEKYIKPKLGTLHVDVIKRQHITPALEEIKDDSREEARKSLSTLNMMFNYALSSGFLSDNPVLGIKANHLGLSASKSKDRWLNLKEIIILWKHLDSSDLKISNQSKIAIKFAILTGARRSEITNMEWSEININKKIWTIPAKRAKNKKVHVVYLSDFALELLEEMKSISGQQKYIFISPLKNQNNQDRNPLSKDALSRAINRLSGDIDIEKFTFHDLRRSAATNWAEELKAGSDVIELMLNHKPQNKLVATYQVGNRSTQQKSVWLKWGKVLMEKLVKSSGTDKVD